MAHEVQTPYASLSRKIERREARVAIVGLGYVGLPLAMEFVGGGFPVYGIDIDEDRVASLKDGTSYVQDVSDADLQAALATGRFNITTDSSVLEESVVIL